MPSLERAGAVAGVLYSRPRRTIGDDALINGLNPPRSQEHRLGGSVGTRSPALHRGLEYKTPATAPDLGGNRCTLSRVLHRGLEYKTPATAWVLTEFNDLAQTFAFGTLPVRIALADIYRGVEFPRE